MTARFSWGYGCESIPLLAVSMEGKVVRYGKVIVKSAEPVAQDVKAWVEIGGQRYND